MKTIAVIVRMFLLLLVVAGCESTGPRVLSDGHQLSESAKGSLTPYDPVKIDIMPLTEFTAAGDSEKLSQIKVCVSLLDAFDCQVKAPAVFRFELYNKVVRSPEPKGRRILLWPDIDLVDAAKNNEHWQDFLRAYEFNLPFEPEDGKIYILQVTSLCPNGRRLSAELALKSTD